jgi:hypothetical protein
MKSISDCSKPNSKKIKLQGASKGASLKQKRSCLKCGEKFPSKGPYNRVCDKCSSMNERVAHNNMQRSFYKESLKLKLSESSRSFNMMGLEGLKVAKSLVLADRVRSRDLFDLYTLMSQFGWRIEDIIETATTLGTVDDPEYYLSVLTGEIPLDANDEGLEAVNMETTKEIENLYLYFKNNVSEYRQNLTVQWVSKNE